MENKLSIILVIIATIINSIVFGYVASNSKNNKTNQSYLLLLSFVILYTIFDCIIIQVFENKIHKDLIVKIQAMLWMPLSFLFLNFIYLFLQKRKNILFYFLSTICLSATLISIFSNKVLLGYKGFNLGTMAFTGNWFLPITFLGVLPSAIFGLYLIGKEGKVLNFLNNKSDKEPFLLFQLKILFFGSFICFITAIITNIFFDEVFGYNGEIHLASLSLSLQSVFLLPALIKYNFLNKPMNKLGDELYANSSDAVFITNTIGIIRNLNNSARNMFKLKGKIINKNIIDLFLSDFILDDPKDNYNTKTKAGNHVSITQTVIKRGNWDMGKILVIRDISPRVKAEQKLLKTKLDYKTLVENSRDIIYNIDLEGNFTFVNSIFEKISGFRKEEIIGMNSNLLVRDDHKNKIQKIFKTLISNNKSLNNTLQTEVPVIIKNGHELWMELGVATIVEENWIIGFSVVSRDITDRKNAEIKLEHLANELTTAQNIAGIGRFKFNYKKNKVVWSNKLYEIYGRDKKVFKPSSESFYTEILHPDSRDVVINLVEKAIKNKSKKIDYIHKVLMPDHTIKWFHAIIDLEYDKKNELSLMNGTSQDITQIYEYQEQLRELSSHIQNVQEQERAKIAHEIHDELGQRLTSMNMDLTFLKGKLINDTSIEIKSRLNALHTLVDETIQITRKISQELRPSILDNLGLISAIEWLQNQYSERSNLNFSLKMPKYDLDINGEFATTIFRITQEALTNIVRHAKATNVIVDLKMENSTVCLSISDDGKGIIKNDNKNHQTFGLFGMKERAAALGGKLKIISNDKIGTTINVMIPILPK